MIFFGNPIPGYLNLMSGFKETAIYDMVEPRIEHGHILCAGTGFEAEIKNNLTSEYTCIKMRHNTFQVCFMSHSFFYKTGFGC